MSTKVGKAAKAVAKKSEKNRVRPPRTEAQKARRRELEAMKRAAKAAQEKPNECKCAKFEAFAKNVVALVKKFGIA